MANTEVLKKIKYNKPGAMDAWWGPYESTAAACLAIPNSVLPVDGIDTNMRQGKVVGIIISGKPIDHYWPGPDYSDAGLKVKVDLSPLATKEELNPIKQYVDDYLKSIFKDAPEGYAFTLVDLSKRLLFYSLINGAVGATQWVDKNIPGSALKDGQVTQAKLSPDFLATLVHSLELIPFQQNKDYTDNTLKPFLPENTQPLTWAFPIIDSAKRILGGWKIDGSFFVSKYDNKSIPGSALKDGQVDYLQLSAALKDGLWQTLDPATGYICAILDINKRIVLGITTTGKVVAKFDYNIADASISLAKLEPSLQATITVGGNRPNPMSWFIGKKLVTLGDSITEQRRWQATLVTLTGMIWSSTETSPGLPIGPSGTLVKMGYGSQTVRPVMSADGTTKPAGGSLYYRADYVQYLAPDVIIVFGGQNDSPNEDVVGTINDPVYTGPELASTDPNPPTFYSSYKGMMVKLMAQNPNARIFAMTRMWNGVYPTINPTPTQKAGMDRINNAIRAVCDLYSIPVIDLAKGIGITPYNASIYYQDDVHPNTPGGIRMANYIANNLN